MSELDEPCPTTGRDPEDCPYCQGEACGTCDNRGRRLGLGSGYVCEHDVIDRHPGAVRLLP